MYTFKKPDYFATTTRSSIEYRAKRELFHAKHLNSAVGFVGSGMTSGYGRLAYNELVRLLMLHVLEALREHMPSASDETGRVAQSPLTSEQHREIRRLGESIAKQLDQPDAFEWRQEETRKVDIRVDFMKDVKTDISMLELLNEMARALGRDDMLAREVARLFQTGPLDQFDSRIRLLGGAPEGVSLHDQWIAAVFGGDPATDQPEAQNTFRKMANAVIPAFQKAYRVNSSSRPLDDQEGCRGDIENAYKEATWAAGVPNPTRAERWYTLMESSFRDINGKYPGYLYDPQENELHMGTPSAPPQMRQVVLNAWALLASVSSRQRKKAFQAIFFSFAHIRDLDDVALGDWPDPVDQTVRILGLTRLLTVNYDHELERFFRRRFGFAFPPTGSDDLNGRGLPRDEAPEERTTAFNGAGMRLIQAEMQRTSVSELLDFAIPHDKDVHIYYLHGRAKNPEETRREHVILTERDYQAHYLADNGVRRGFDEGLRSLFAANTVIFLGIGMSEEDLLRPLREFVSNDQKLRRTSGGPVVIMNGGGESADEQKAVSFNVRYGTKSMFYPCKVSWGEGEDENLDRKSLRDFAGKIEKACKRVNAGAAACARIKAAKKRVEKAQEKKAQAEAAAVPKDLEDAEAELTFVMAKWEKAKEDKARADAKDTYKPEWPTRLDDTRIPAATKGLHRLDQELKLPGKNDHDGWLLLHAFTGRLETHLMSQSLHNFVSKLGHDYQIWLEEISRLPDQRVARFVEWPHTDNDPAAVYEGRWIRQRIVHADGENQFGKDCPHLADVSEAVRKGAFLDKAKEGCRRVLRLWGPRGVGKGALIHALQQGYGDVFEPPNGLSTYGGSFFADARYSTEINSIMTAFARFVHGRAEYLRSGCERAAKKAELDLFGEGKQPRLQALEPCLDEIEKGLEAFAEAGVAKQSVGEKRLFICLSGLERLFRPTGEPYQALHGEFFRQLLEDNFAKFPIDVVLLAGAEDVRQVERIEPLQGGKDPALFRQQQYLKQAKALDEGKTPEPVLPKDEHVSFPGFEDSGKSSFDRSESIYSPVEPESQHEVDSGRDTKNKPPMADWMWFGLDYKPIITKDLRVGGTVLSHAWIEGTLKGDSAALKLLWEILNEALGATPEERGPFYFKVQTICHLLERNVCMQLWLCKLVEAVDAGDFWSVLNFHPDNEDGDPATEARCKKLLLRLEAAALISEEEVIEFIMQCYRMMDEPRRTGRPNARYASTATIHDEILRHLAFFSVPVERSVLASCPRLHDLAATELSAELKGKKLTERRAAIWLNQHLETLFERRLIIRIYPSRPRGHDWQDQEAAGKKAHVRYFLHSRIRTHISMQMNFNLFELGEHSFFNLSSFGAQPRDLPSPRTHDYRFVGDILHRLIWQTRQELHPFFDEKEKRNRTERDERDGWQESRIKRMDTPLSPTRRARAAHSLLAGSFSIGVITRFDNVRDRPGGNWEEETPFDNYDGWLRSLLNMANGIDDRETKYVEVVKKVFVEANNAGKIRKEEERPDVREDPQGFDPGIDWTKVGGVTRPFYPNEIVWILNERGLCKLVQGKIGESLGIFRNARAAMDVLRWKKHDEYGVTCSPARVLAINHAIALIENGRSGEARSLLDPIVSQFKKSPRGLAGTITPHTARGYVGLIEHLQGRLGAAEDEYRAAIAALRDWQVPRGTAIFSRHLADLLRGLNRLNDAEIEAKIALAEARSTRQMDIVHMTQISLARIMYKQDKAKLHAARKMVDEARVYGERLGIPKIMVEADTFLAGVAIDQNDLDSAGHKLVGALALSSRYGMNMRKISAVHGFIRLAEAREDSKLVRRLRRKMNDLCEQFDYQYSNDKPTT